MKTTRSLLDGKFVQGFVKIIITVSLCLCLLFFQCFPLLFRGTAWSWRRRRWARQGGCFCCRSRWTYESTQLSDGRNNVSWSRKPLLFLLLGLLVPLTLDTPVRNSNQDIPFSLWARYLQEQTPPPSSPCPHPEALFTHNSFDEHM